MGSHGRGSLRVMFFSVPPWLKVASRRRKVSFFEQHAAKLFGLWSCCLNCKKFACRDIAISDPI